MCSGSSRSVRYCRLPWRHAAQRRDPALRCARAQRDGALMIDIERVWQTSRQVYGVDKVWRQLSREGIVVARCTVGRLMRRLGLCGRCSWQGRAHHGGECDYALPLGSDQLTVQRRAARSVVGLRFHLRLDLAALGSSHWICSCVLLLGEFYWGDEDADDTALPRLQFRQHRRPRSP